MFTPKLFIINDLIFFFPLRPIKDYKKQNSNNILIKNVTKYNDIFAVYSQSVFTFLHKVSKSNKRFTYLFLTLNS